MLAGARDRYWSIKKYKEATAARIIRYQPKTLKSLVLMKDMRKRMARTDTTKATTMPVRRTAPSVAVKWRPKSSS